MNESKFDFLFSKRNLIIFSMIILVFRIIYVLFILERVHSAEDFQIALNITSGLGYNYLPVDVPTAVKSPVYPLFLSIFIMLFAASAKIMIVIVQHCIASVIPIIIVKVSESINEKHIGFVAAWCYLLHPSYFYYSSVIEVTNIFIPLFLLWIYFTIKLFKNISTKNSIVSGVFSGIILLTQPIAGMIIISPIVYLLIRKKWKSSIVIIASVICILSPWIIRNYYVFDKFIPTKSPFWMNIYLGFNPDYTISDKYDLINPSYKLQIDSLLAEGTSDVYMEQYYKKAVEETLTENTYLYFEKTICQAASYWWVPPRYISDNSLQILAVRKIPVVVLNILFLPGIVLLFKKNRHFAIIISSILLYFTLVYALTTIVNVRFKLDIEWIELFAVGALFVRIFKIDTNK